MIRLNSSPIQITNKADVWGAGIAAINLFTGTDLMPDVIRGYEVEDKLVSFGSDFNNRAVSNTLNGQLPNDTFMHSTGDPDIDNLINGLLHPDPTQRLTVDQALNHVAFTKQGVGTNATFTQIQNLA